MVRKLATDQSGMTLPLAMMMILLIGAMGAGLLAFVQTDLQSVIEVNRGQRALDIADAGVQVAKSHLRVDSFREHYDTNRANDCNEGPRVGGGNWSKATDTYTASTGACTGPSTRSDVASTPWREDQGVTKCFPDAECDAAGTGRFHVTIECFDQNSDPSPDPCDTGTGSAPDPAAKAEDKKFFKITSTGYDTSDGDGSIRKVEAIYTTARRTYAPIAYWTPRNILFSGGGSMSVSKLSFFAGRNIQGVRKTTAGTTIADRDTPAIYENWSTTSYNTTPRKNADNLDLNGAGFGAVGFVCGASNQSCNSTNTANQDADGYNDYDSTSGTLRSGPVGRACNTSRPIPRRCIAFVSSAPNPTPSNQITFPFDARNAIANPRDIVDPGLVEEMKSAAQAQGLVRTTSHTLNIWPSSGEVTYFVDGADLTYSAPSGQGMIVVRNGNVTLQASSHFKGVIIVIGDGNTTGFFENKGNGNLDGYVTASGDMTIRGNVNPALSLKEITLLNNFYDVKLWSWRELYQ
jgi:hypothetical protein